MQLSRESGSTDTGTMRRLALAICIGLVAAVPAPAREVYEELQARVISVADQVKPSVVHIEAIVKINDRRSQVTGSGVIATPEGRILTNHHVVHKAEKVEVTVPGHRQKYPARILGTDKQTDIALIEIDPDTPLPSARFGSSAELRVGQWVLAIGNPYGLDGTVSIGIVSAKGRNLKIPHLLNDFIQTDAMIDRGSSGGPLVDLDGRVVGVNSRGQGRGIGFTIPIETALDVVRQIEKGGVERGWLGISMQALDRDLADYFGVPDATGVVVNSVTTDSPAEDAKLRTGDIITRFNGVEVEAEKEEDLGVFQRQVASVTPGEKRELEILRDKKQKRLTVKIGTQPKVQPDEAEIEFGFNVQEITENLYREQRLFVHDGAYVSFVSRGSPAAEAGLSTGDVIQRIEEDDVRDLRSLERAIAKVDALASFLITARRGDETKFLLVKRGSGRPTVETPEGDTGEAAHAPKKSGPESP